MFAIVASLNYLEGGMSVGLVSTLVYSLDHGMEGISTALEDATWIRKNMFKGKN